jgi:hypothetical protein
MHTRVRGVRTSLRVARLLTATAVRRRPRRIGSVVVGLAAFSMIACRVGSRSRSSTVGEVARLLGTRLGPLTFRLLSM